MHATKSWSGCLITLCWGSVWLFLSHLLIVHHFHVNKKHEKTLNILIAATVYDQKNPLQKIVFDQHTGAKVFCLRFWYTSHFIVSFAFSDFQGSKVRFCYHFEFFGKIDTKWLYFDGESPSSFICHAEIRTIFQFLSEGGQRTAFESGLFLAVIMG